MPITSVSRVAAYCDDCGETALNDVGGPLFFDRPSLEATLTPHGWLFQAPGADRPIVVLCPDCAEAASRLAAVLSGDVEVPDLFAGSAETPHG